MCALIQYLSIESSFDGKDAVCERALQFLLDSAEGAVEEHSSFHLLETLLYRTQLSVFTGRAQNAQHILQVGLTCAQSHTGTLTNTSRRVNTFSWFRVC